MLERDEFGEIDFSNVGDDELMRMVSGTVNPILNQHHHHDDDVMDGMDMEDNMDGGGSNMMMMMMNNYDDGMSSSSGGGGGSHHISNKELEKNMVDVGFYNGMGPHTCHSSL